VYYYETSVAFYSDKDRCVGPLVAYTVSTFLVL